MIGIKELARIKMSRRFFKAKIETTKFIGDLEPKLPWRIYEDSK